MFTETGYTATLIKRFIVTSYNMKNKPLGALVVLMAVVLGFIMRSYDASLKNSITNQCIQGTHDLMTASMNFQANVIVSILIILAAVGLYLIFFSREEKIVTRTVKEQVNAKKVTKENYRKIINGLNPDEKSVFEKIIESEGTAFQSDLVDKTGFHKVKITRILDKLEGKGLIERKRRGMTNVVILKK